MRRAADHEYAAARYVLGSLYSNGRGGKKTSPRRCAGIGLPPACNSPLSKVGAATRTDATWNETMPGGALCRRLPNMDIRVGNALAFMLRTVAACL